MKQCSRCLTWLDESNFHKKYEFGDMTLCAAQREGVAGYGFTLWEARANAIVEAFKRWEEEEG